MALTISSYKILRTSYPVNLACTLRLRILPILLRPNHFEVSLESLSLKHCTYQHMNFHSWCRQIHSKSGLCDFNPSAIHVFIKPLISESFTIFLRKKDLFTLYGMQ